MRDDKREFRERKRQIKQKGNRKRRRFFKRALDREPPDDQPEDFNFGRWTSEPLNGPEGMERLPGRDE